MCSINWIHSLRLCSPSFIHKHTHMHTNTLYLTSHPCFLFFPPLPFFLLSLSLFWRTFFSTQIQVKHLGQLISSGTRLAGYCWQDVWAGAVYSVGIPNTHIHTHTHAQDADTPTHTHSHSLLTLFLSSPFNLISRCRDSCPTCGWMLEQHEGFLSMWNQTRHMK